MAPRLWDPYKVLNITGRDKNWMHCVGHVASHDDARCRWKIPSDSFAEVVSILGMMETKPPTEISSKILSRLASLSLCENYHQWQKYRILDEWEEEINAATRDYEKLEKWKMHCKDISATNKRLLAQLEESSNREQSQDSEAETYAEEVSERLEEQLNLERQAFKKYRRDAEAAKKRQTAVETALQSKLAEAERILAQQQKDIKRLTLRESELLNETMDLSSSLARERMGTETIQQQMGQLRKDLSGEIESLQEKLSNERQNLAETKQMLNGATRNEEACLESIENLRCQIADERQKYVGLHAELKAIRIQEAGMREQLLNEQHELDHLRKSLDNAETKVAAVSEEAESLRSQLDGERQKSEQLSNTFSSKITDLNTQLDTQKEKTDRLDHELSMLKTENVSVAAQLSTERQTSLRLQKSLDQANTVQASLVEQTKRFQIDAETSHQETGRLTLELDFSKSKEAALVRQLEEIEATTAARDAAFLTEKAMMLEQIANLEKNSVREMFRAFEERLKKIMKDATSRLASGRSRRQIVADERLEQGVA
jgi:chromosome segregation ATPase